jgi:2-C-methyl-D-erythritol 4-phosphate cytidylyltransferase
MLKSAVIVAGGSGSRMGASIPKQFLDLRGKPVIVHTVKAFRQAFEDIVIILVLPVSHMAEGERMMQEHVPGGRILFVQGGETRFHSVQNGLRHVNGPSIVFVHDAVRCLVSPALIRSCYDQAIRLGSAIPAVPVRDSLRRRVEGGTVVVDREGMVLVQTPQTFRSDQLIPAYAQAYHPAFTDEATVVEASGTAVQLVEGEETNIKLTLPADLIMAEMILDRRQA